MEKINSNYILLGIPFIMLFLIVVIMFAKWKDVEPTEPAELPIEHLRQEYLNTYSKQIQEVQEIKEEKTEKKEQLRRDIKELWVQENQLKECLQANSMTGAVVDCDLHFNNNKDEQNRTTK